MDYDLFYSSLLALLYVPDCLDENGALLKCGALSNNN